MERTHHQQIPVPATLDVQSVERELNELWKRQNREARDDDNEGAMMRARVLNLMIYVSGEDALDEINEALAEVATTHPCRAIVMCALRAGADKDIEMFISAFCQEREGEASERQLCCEQVSLIARGRFTVELPSAAVPLLVSDLPTFLYWHDEARFTQETFKRLSHEASRVVIDSAMFGKPHENMLALAAFMEKDLDEGAAVSDLNWARLTAWRALLAGFFDAPESRAHLERITGVLVEYVAHESAQEEIAPQALMIVGWLASRLGWRASDGKIEDVDAVTKRVSITKDGRVIAVELKQVERPEMRRGRLARVRLETTDDTRASFEVLRSEDGVYLETCAREREESRGERVFKVRNRSTGNLLGRELEIPSQDRIYEEAVAAAVELIRAE